MRMNTRALSPLVGILAIALAVTPVAAVATSQAAIPGEALYGLKRATEAITAPAALDRLDRRVGELEALADRGADPALVTQTAQDIEASVPDVVHEADSLDEIEQAQAGLAEAEAAITAVMDRLGTDHESYFGLSTALDALAEGVDGLETAENALNQGEDPSVGPDVPAAEV